MVNEGFSSDSLLKQVKILVMSRVIPGTPQGHGTPKNGRLRILWDPYRMGPISLLILMGIVWEAYYKGGPVLGSS